uniref:Protein FMC1 homolog n=1 Tax=Cyprinus carpio carpio TaxID=630221 RepID=A0A9J8ABK2_CYPCA
MAAVTSPLRACRGILKELRIAKGSDYRNTLVYKHVLEQFRRNQFCRARMDALHAARTYLCLLTSTRMHLRLHERYHGRGDRALEEVAGLVGLRLPTQPGGKGWET